jgi:hypothetical protein
MNGQDTHMNGYEDEFQDVRFQDMANGESRVLE